MFIFIRLCIFMLHSMFYRLPRFLLFCYFLDELCLDALLPLCSCFKFFFIYMFSSFMHFYFIIYGFHFLFGVFLCVGA